LQQLDHASLARRAEVNGGGPAAGAVSAGRRLKLLAGAIAVVLLVGFIAVRHADRSADRALAQTTAKQAATPPAVIVVPAGKAPAVEHLALPGETGAWHESTIYARVNGYVGKWFVDIGDHVRKGQVLATIETPDLDSELAASQAKLKASEADVKVREAEAAFAKTTYERWRDSPKGVVSEQEREAKKADYDSAVARLNASNAQVVLTQADVDRLTTLTQFKQVTAPYDGVIIERRIDIGNLVTAGSTTSTTLLYRMSQDDPMRVFVDVPQSAAAGMPVGQPTEITANSLPGQIFRGAITRTAQAIDPRARTLRVEIDIPNPRETLVPGMYVNVAFDLEARGLVQVPAGALVFRAGGPQVAVVDAGGTVSFHDVTIARDDGNVVEIGSGLLPGEQIVLNISSQIADGDKVTIAKGNEEIASVGKGVP
jgi:RND family efflux transporter MFP subunit